MEYFALLIFALKNSENTEDISKKPLHAVAMRVSLEKILPTFL